MRIGNGYDVHNFCENRPLVLGGVHIPFNMGLMGHSDADVLVHAICDSLLGAAALGDIGKHFPDSDDKYKGISSLLLLKKTGELLEENNYKIENIDSILALEAPKVGKFISDMRNNIAKSLNIPVDNISVKATTQEGLGFVGRKEGVAAYAVCLIEKK